MARESERLDHMRSESDLPNPKNVSTAKWRLWSGCYPRFQLHPLL